MPSFSDIEDRIEIEGFDGTGAFNNTAIKALFAQAFEGSVSLAAKVTSWLNDPSNAGKKIKIMYTPASDPREPGFALAGEGQIFISPDRCDDLLYITDEGKAMAHSVLSVLVHEIGHAVTGEDDAPTYANLKGRNIALYVNDWYGELGIPQEAGYASRARAEAGILIAGKDYTDGQAIANAIVDPGGQPPSLAVDVVNPDFLGHGVTGPSLFVGSSLDNDVEGTDSADYLYGAGGADYFRGASGSDKLYGEDGDDYIEGGNDNDTIYGGSGEDQLLGDDGADAIYAGEEADSIEGGAGDDILNGEEGNDTLDGGDDNDVLIGGRGEDNLYLSAGDDTIDGGGDVDTVTVADSMNSITIDLRIKENGITAISFSGSKSLVDGIEIYVGNDSKTTFKGDGTGAIFKAGSGGGEFHLLAGDKGVGYAGVVDTFYLQTTIPEGLTFSSDAEKIEYLKRNKVFIENFGAEDLIYVNGVLFNGNKVTSAVWGETVGSDRNLDRPINAYTLTGDSSYGTAYGVPTFETRGVSGSGTPWGALVYSETQYRDVTYSVADETGIGIINLFSRGTNSMEVADSSYSAGDTGFTFNELTTNDEQLTVVIDGFQNGDGGITFENDALANFRPGLTDIESTEPFSRNFDTAWGADPAVPVSQGQDIFDGNADGSIVPGGSSVDADDPRFNLGYKPFEWQDVDWDAFISAPLNIAGSIGSDTLEGGWANDEISGGDGDDYIVGGPGDDVLNGGAGNDEILGGDGNDTLIGGTGDDILFGEAGSNLVEGGDGIDRADFSGSASDYRIYRNLDGSVGVDHLLGESSAVVTGVELLYFDDLGEQIATADLPLGTSGNDVLTGSERADLIDGGIGDDSISGGVGDDMFVVDSAGDIVIENLSEGNDTIQTSLTAYTLGAEVENLIFSGTGSFSGNGNELDNTIVGAAGDDTLAGGDGDDHFIAGGGVDVIDGGEGGDTLELSGTPTEYSYVKDELGVITISNGINSIQLTDVESVSFAQGARYAVDELLSMYVSGTAGNDAILAGDSEDNRINGFAGDDNLRGNEGNDLINGGEGNDTAYYSGNSGDYEIFHNESGGLIVLGDDGTDMLSNVEGLHFDGDNVTIDVSTIAPLGTSGDDVIVGSARADRLFGLAGNDGLSGGDAGDQLEGGTGDDSLDGGEGSDSLNGGIGNDTLSGDGGNDTLTGSGGDDAYLFGRGDGVDVIKEYSGYSSGESEGNDTLVFGAGIAPADVQVSRTNSGRNFVLTITGTTDKVTLQDSAYSVLYNIEAVQFSDGTTWTHADLMAKVLVPTSGNDTLYGSFAAETISSGAGNDTIVAREGDDILTGGTGNDNITGGDGNDIYHFALGDGQDIITDYTGNVSASLDAIEFGAGILPSNLVVSQTDSGKDLVLSITGTTSKVTLNDAVFTAGYRIEEVRFANGTVWTYADMMAQAFAPKSTADSYWGTSSADLISGGGGNDTILGSEGDDTLFGDEGNDALNGGAGNDQLDGGAGTDTMVGGTGNDNYIVDSVSDVVTELTSAGTDTISAYVTYTLGSGVENLSLVGAGTINGTGNALGNAIYGNDAANVLQGLGGNDHLEAGGGEDALEGGSGNDTLDGGAGSDVAHFAGIQADYSIVTNSGSISVIDNKSAVDGDEGSDTLYGMETLQFQDSTVNLAAPIVLDLDGDGVELIDRNRSRARFDWDDDGSRNRTGWVGRDDGLLVYDRNGDGKVSGSSELSFTSDKEGAKSDLDGLTAFDSNGDGLFSAEDEEFSDFRVWRDGNSDGKAERGELMTLEEAGIASLTLAGEAMNQSWGWDQNIVINNGSYTRTDGTAGMLADVALNYTVPDAIGAASSSVAIQSTASQLAEAIATFGAERGMGDLFAQQHWVDKRDMLFAVSNRFDLR